MKNNEDLIVEIMAWISVITLATAFIYLMAK
jgi:hypothetical protein